MRVVSAILRSGRNKAKTKKSKKKKDFLDTTNQKEDDHSMTWVILSNTCILIEYLSYVQRREGRAS